MADTNRYGKLGPHHRLNQQHTESRYWLRQGMAKVALEAKVTGKPAEDSVGRPLKYANELAERHSTSQIQRWAKDHRPVGGFAGMEFRCARCHHLKRRGKCRCHVKIYQGVKLIKSSHGVSCLVPN